MSSDNAIPSGPTGMSGQLQVPETVGKMEASSQASTTPRDHWEIVTLNVGGRREGEGIDRPLKLWYRGSMG